MTTRILLLAGLLCALWGIAAGRAYGAEVRPREECRDFAWGEMLVEPLNTPLCLPPQFASETWVITCESQWNPYAVGPLQEIGYWQVHVEHHHDAMARQGLDYRSLRDAAKYAVQLWRERGWQPWYSSKECHGVE